MLFETVIVAATLLAADAGPKVPVARGWDLWIEASELAATAPDSALGWAAARRARDPEDLFAALASATVLARDSAAADSLAGQGDAAGAGPAARVAAGVAHLSRGRAASGQASLARARDAYLALARGGDAARAILFAALLDRRGRSADDPALAEAERLALAAGDTEALLHARVLRGSRLQRGDLPAASRLLAAVVTLADSLGPCYATAETHRQLAVALKGQGLLDSARTHYARAEQAAAQLGRPALHARSIHGLATTLEAEGRTDEAVAMYRRALEIAPAAEHTLRANLLGQIGAASLGMKRYDDARRSFEASNEILERFDPDADGRVLNWDYLGGISALRGELERSRECFETALALCRRYGHRHREGPLLMHYAEFHFDAGDLGQAEKLIDEGLRALRESGRGRIEGVMLTLRADVQLEHGAYPEALATAREAAVALRRADPGALPIAYRHAARACIALGRLDEALAFADSAYRFGTERGDSSTLAQGRLILAETLIARGDEERALAELEPARAFAERVQAPDLLEAVEARRGSALLAVGRAADAVAALERSLDLHERVRSSLATTEDRSRYQTRWQETYVTLATALVRAGRTADAFRVVDRGRARGLRERFGRSLPAASRDLPPPLLAEARTVQRNLEEAQGALVAEYARAGSGATRGLGTLEARCRTMREAAAGVAQRIERHAPGYASEAGIARPMGAAEARRHLRKDDTLLLYLVGRDRTLVFVATRRGLVAREIAWSEAELARRVDELLAGIAEGGDRWGAAAASLADSLLPAGRFAAPGRLLISADGPLHRLPFETLKVRAGPARRLLVESHLVVYGPSPALLFAGEPVRRDVRAAFAVFGDPEVAAATATLQRGGDGAQEFSVAPLPHARREAQGIARRFPEARAYFGAEATEARAIEELERCDRLHIAAHAFVDENNPRFSGLVLARSADGRGDGLLQAYEVAARKGRLSLVTLSACESGRGPVQRGEGLLGLARAFRVAGTRNLVASLWKVDDGATADFMLEFYDRLSRGESPARALAGVKRAWILAGDGASRAAAADPAGPASGARGVGRTPLAEIHRHPQQWAAFVLHGVAEP